MSEFRILTLNAPAEYGETSGSIFHGGLYEFPRNNAWIRVTSSPLKSSLCTAINTEPLLGCRRAMAGLAEIAVVLRRNKCRDHLAPATCERAEAAQRHFRQVRRGAAVSGRKASALVIPGSPSGN